MRPDRDAFTSRAKFAAASLSEMLHPALRVAARARSGRPTAPREWRRGIILGHNHIGDVLCRTASLAPLRAALPDCEWDYVVSPHAAELLEHEPAIRRTVRVERAAGAWPWTRLPWRELRARRYDVALCTTALGPEADFLLAAALGIPNRVGVAHKGLTGLLTRAVRTPRTAPPGEYLRAIVADVAGRAPDWSLRPVLHTDAGDVESGEHAYGVARGDAATLVACSITTRQDQPRWPVERYLEVLARVHERTGAAIALCGAPADRAALEGVASEARVPCAVVAGELGVRAFAELLRRCAAVLTVDSGTRHLANAVSTPCVFLRNLRTTQSEGGAYVDGEVDVLADVARCEPADASRALDALHADVVTERLLAAIERAAR